MNNCQICTQKSYIAFNWKYAHEAKDKELAQLAIHLQPIRPLKFGTLYQCPVSQNYWFLNDDSSSMCSVPPDKVELLWQWGRHPLVLNHAQTQMLAEIGAIECEKYGKGEIRVPCMIKRSQNEVYDPALVIITKMPPIQRWHKRILLGHNDDSITPSDFALPLSVRIATFNADEINMGFAPTLVKSSDNQYFVLSGAKQIFSYGQWKGKDISLSDRSFHRGDNFPIVNEDIDHITFVYYDWCEEYHKLIQKAVG